MFFFAWQTEGIKEMNLASFKWSDTMVDILAMHWNSSADPEMSLDLIEEACSVEQ